MENTITYTCCGVFPGKKLKGENQYKRLYHFTRLSSFLMIWVNKTLRFGEISSVNDIYEIDKRISMSLDLANYASFQDDFNQAASYYRSIMGKYKQISLTMDYDSYYRGCMSPMMWGHYGDKRNGVCVELDFSELEFPPTMIHKKVKYKKYLPFSKKITEEQNSFESMSKFIDKNIDHFFFTKTDDWKGENEYRIISKEDAYLDISKAIKVIYITDPNNDTCKIIKALVKDEIPIFRLKHQNVQGKKIPIVFDINKE